MVLNQERGGYARGPVVRVRGSFRTNGAGAPDIIRDGGSKCVKSVSRVSAGLYLVTIDAGFPMPELPEVRAFKNGSATPTKACSVEYVIDSWNKTARTLQLVCVLTSTNVVGDPDASDRIGFELVGSISSTGTDPA